MTVSSSTDRATFPGNGVATAFSLPFRFFANSDVVAQAIVDATGVATPLTLGIDYLLTGAGQPEEAGAATGVLTTLAPVPAGVSLFIQRIIPATQPTDIVNQGRFFPEVHETVFDRLTMLVQQNEGSLGRALRVQDYDPLPAQLPSAVQRANRILSFDVNGDPVAIDAAVDSALALRQEITPLLTSLNDSFGFPELYGAIGDGVTDDSAAIIAAANAHNLVILSSPGGYVAQGLPIRTGLIYEGAGGLVKLSLPVGATDHLFKTTGDTDLIDSGGLKNIYLKGIGGSLRNGADFSSLFSKQLNYWVADNCVFDGFNRGYNGTNNDRMPVFKACRFINNDIGAFGGEHPLFIGCDFRENRVGLSGRFNDLKVSDCKFVRNVKGVDTEGGQFVNSSFTGCQWFRNSEVGIACGSRVAITGCLIVGNGAGSSCVNLLTGNGNTITGNIFGQGGAEVSADYNILVSGTSGVAARLTNISANKFISSVIADIKLNKEVSEYTIDGNTSEQTNFISATSIINSCVSANNFTSTLGSFLALSGGSYNCAISGNSIAWGSAGPVISIPLVPALQGNAITGNIFNKIGSGDGSIFAGSLNRSTFSANRASGNAKLLFGSFTYIDAIVMSNAGIKVSQRGAFQIADGGTSVVVPYDVDSPITVGNIDIRPTTNSASASRVHVSAVDLVGKTFTVTAQSAVGANSQYAFFISSFDA